MSIIDLSHLFSTLYAGLKLGKEPHAFGWTLMCFNSNGFLVIQPRSNVISLAKGNRDHSK